MLVVYIILKGKCPIDASGLHYFMISQIFVYFKLAEKAAASGCLFLHHYSVMSSHLAMLIVSQLEQLFSLSSSFWDAWCSDKNRKIIVFRLLWTIKV